MTYYLATFNSQTQTYNFQRILQAYGIRAAIVQTPQQIGKACGLSVKIFSRDGLQQARTILSNNQFSSFVSFFEITQMGPENTQIKRI